MTNPAPKGYVYLGKRKDINVPPSWNNPKKIAPKEDYLDLGWFSSWGAWNAHKVWVNNVSESSLDLEIYAPINGTLHNLNKEKTMKPKELSLKGYTQITSGVIKRGDTLKWSHGDMEKANGLIGAKITGVPMVYRRIHKSSNDKTIADLTRELEKATTENTLLTKELAEVKRRLALAENARDTYKKMHAESEAKLNDARRKFRDFQDMF